jgi:polysaccharide deacetylase family protein (PEP-CTERM system associated)
VTPPHAAGRIKHFFTVDVEEYFQVVALAPYAPMAKWESFESRVEASVDELLALMARYDALGTFFTVGWVAERHPEMMRRIVSAGHEVASHTYDHVRITHQTPEHFRESVRRTKAIIEDVTGSAVLGFRAPSFSIIPGTEWALDVLIEEGHAYDSSLFPVRRKGYGYPGGARDPYWIERPVGRIAEFPPATLRVMGMTLPAAGGAYFRILPPGLVHAALRSAAGRGAPGTFYIHPWEWDPGQPRLAVPALTRVRHYAGQGGVLARIERAFRMFAFTSIRDGSPLDLGTAAATSPTTAPSVRQ